MRILKTSLLFLMLLISPFAHAVVINFDALNTSEAIPNGYEGLQWNNFFTIDGTLESPGSGYDLGTVSEDNVAFNGFAAPSAVSDSDFSFCSAWLTGAWNNGLEVTVEGWLQNAQQYSHTVAVFSTGPTQFQFNFNGIDELRFSSTGGINSGTGGIGAQFALDDMVIEFQADCSASVMETLPVPTMSQWALLLMTLVLAFTGFIALRRRG